MGSYFIVGNIGMNKSAKVEIVLVLLGIALFIIGIAIDSETVQAFSGVFIASAVVSAGIGVLSR